MPYKYLDEIATADIAFCAWGKSEAEMFSQAGDALINVMVEDLRSISAHKEKNIYLEAETLEMLLFKFLQELIFFKDSERIFLRVVRISLDPQTNQCSLSCDLAGETIDRDKHSLKVDVKAVTFHRFKVERKKGIFTCTIVLDI